SLVAFPDMFDELERLVSASLDVCEDLNSPVQLPSVESFRQYEDSTVKIGKAMARLDNKMSCFLCCRRKWQLCQIVLLQTDTRLIVIYTDTDKGFVLDLIEAKHYEFMLEEDNEGKRQCRIKIKWEFGNVQLRFVEAQIGTWQKYVLDSFDRIFKTPRPPTYLRKHSEESACVGTEQSSDDFSTTESGFSRRSITETNRLRHTPHLEDLPTISDIIHNEVCYEHLTTSSKAPQMKQLRSQQARKHALALTNIYESPAGIAQEAVQTETVANDEQPSKAGQNTATTMLKNHSSGVQITGGSSEDGSTLSMTSGTGSPTAYEGDISIVPETITTSHDHNSSFTTHTLPPSYDQPAAPIASSSYTRSEWLHVSKPKVPDYVVQPWQREHYLLEDYDDDTPTSKPMRRPEL
uniref:Secreted protein n=1 Tax=Parascaris univalens TaxID=6257 RepID=A0A915BAJ5_PARUN